MTVLYNDVVDTGTRFTIQCMFFSQETEQLNVSSGLKMLMQRSEVSLSWNGGLSLRSGRMSREITYEFLEPFSHGNCSQHYNCLACLTDSLCSWCQVMAHFVLSLCPCV